jgi:DNA-binding MarR family transcriptional regulator
MWHLRQGSDGMAGKKAGRQLDLGGLEQFVGYALRRTQVAVFEDVITRLAAFDLRPAQYSVLLLVAENPGCKQTEIADALGIKRPNFVAMLHALERRKLLRRAPSSTDRRARILVLTAQGEEALQSAKIILKAHERQLAARLGAGGKSRLMGLLAKLSS